MDSLLPAEGAQVYAVRILSYALACFLCHHALFPVLKAVLPEAAKLPRPKMIDARNRLVSASHATVMCGMTAYYWIVQNRDLRVPAAEEALPAAQFDMMLGYLLYDSIYVGIFAPGALDVPTMCHHVFGLVSLAAGHFQSDGPTSFYLMVRAAPPRRLLLAAGAPS